LPVIIDISGEEDDTANEEGHMAGKSTANTEIQEAPRSHGHLGQAIIFAFCGLMILHFEILSEFTLPL